MGKDESRSRRGRIRAVQRARRHVPGGGLRAVGGHPHQPADRADHGRRDQPEPRPPRRAQGHAGRQRGRGVRARDPDGDDEPGAIAAAASFKFEEIEAAIDETHHVPSGYKADVLIRWGDPVEPGAPAFDPMKADGGGPGETVWLQLRLHRLPAAAARQQRLRARALVRQPRIHQRGAHVPGPRPSGEDGLRRNDAGAGRHRDGRPRCLGGRDREAERRLDARSRQPLQPTHHSTRDGDAPLRARRRPRADVHVLRSERHPGDRHDQQLRRRHHPLGHLPHRRGELPRLLPQQGGARPVTRRSGTTSATASPASGTTGAGTTSASTSPRSRTRPTGSAGSSRSTPSTARRRRSSARRSAASSTRAPRSSSTRTAASSSIWTTTSASTMSTSS